MYPVHHPYPARDYGASTLENMLYVNVMGLFIVAAAAWYVDGREVWEYMRDTDMAATLLVMRSVTFYFGALVFTELTRHSVRSAEGRGGCMRTEPPFPFSGFFLVSLRMQ